MQAAARDLAAMEAAITAQGWMQPFCLLDHSEDEDEDGQRPRCCSPRVGSC